MTEENSIFSLKTGNDLFDDKQATKVSSIFRIKKNKNIWEIWKDKEIISKLPEYRFNKSEKRFLYTSDGMIFLLSQAKLGIHTFSEIKKNLKQHV